MNAALHANASLHTHSVLAAQPLKTSNACRQTPPNTLACPQKALEQQQQPGQQLPLPEGAPSEWEQDFITWYRNTFLVAGAGLVGSIWHWNFGEPQSN